MSRPASWRSGALVTPLLLALIPPALVARAIAQYGVNVPVQDQWRFAPQVFAYLDGQLEWAAFWAPFGPHRITLPKAFMLFLADATAWNTRAEMWFDFALTAVAVLLLADVARRTLAEHAPARWPWAVALSSALLFSMGAWHGWTLGWMMNLYLAVFGASLCAWGLACFGPSAAGVTVMILGAAVAAYSYLGALPLLVLAPLAAWIHPDAHGARRPALIGGVIAAALIGLYFVGYPTRGVSAEVGRGGIGGPEAVVFVLRYLGSRLCGWRPELAMAWGAAGATIAGVGAVTFVLSPGNRRSLLPWLLLLAYVVVAGALTAAGRHQGPKAPLLSRYAMLPALFWAAAVPSAVICWGALGLRAAPGPVRAGARLCTAGVLAFAAWGYVETWQGGVAASAARHARLTVATACLRERRPSTACLQLLSRHSPQLVLRLRRPLRARGLGPFASGGAARSG